MRHTDGVDSGQRDQISSCPYGERACAQLLETILGNGPCPSLLLNEHGSILWANSLTHSLLRCSSLDALRGKEFSSLIRFQSSAGDVPPLSAAGAQLSSQYLTVICEDRTPIPVEVRRAPVNTADSQMQVVFLTDCSASHHISTRISIDDTFYLHRLGRLELPVFRKKVSPTPCPQSPHTWIWVNPKFCEEVHKHPTELLGSSDYKVFPPDLAARYQGDDTRVVSTRLSLELIEPHMPGKDESSAYDVHVIKVPVFDKAKVVEILCIYWKVEKEREVLQLLRKEEDDYRTLLRSLVENVPIFLYRKNASKQFTFATNVYCKTEGISLDDLIGKTDFDIHPQDLARKYSEDDDNVLITGCPVSAEEPHVTGRKAEMYVKVVKTPLFDEGRNILGLQGIFWDITDKRAIEQQIRTSENEISLRQKALEGARSELATAHNHLSQLARKLAISAVSSAVTHDAAKPLTQIRTIAARIQRGQRAASESQMAFSDDLSKIIEICETARAPLGQITVDGRGQIEKTPIDLAAILNEMVANLNRTVPEGKCIEAVIPHDLPPLRCNSILVQIAVEHLISNALRNAPKDSNVRLTVQHVAGHIGITIWDEGLGVEFDRVGELFVPRSKSENGTTQQSSGGLGIGLAIAQSIIKLHAGEFRPRKLPNGMAITAVFPLNEN